MNIKSISNKISNAPRLDFGDIFSNSIELFKKVWVQGLVIQMLNIVFGFAFLLVLYIPLMFLGVVGAISGGMAQESGSPEAILAGLGLFAGLVLIVLYFVVIIGMATIALGLKSAFYRISKTKDLSEATREDYFYFLSKRYRKKTITLACITIGIGLVATMLCVLPLFYVIVPLSLLPVVYAFNPDLTTSDITNLSFQLGNKKWLITFGILIVSSFLAAFLGILICFVGIYFTISFSYLPMYFIYKDAVGFNAENNEDEDDDEIKFLEV